MLTTTNVKNTYAGNGVTTLFPITFQFQENTQIYVFSRNTTTLVDTVLTVGSNYTVNGGDPGNEIQLSVALASGNDLYIYRVTPVIQDDFDAINNSAFLAEDLEAALDRDVMMLQEIGDRIPTEIDLVSIQDNADAAAASAAAAAASEVTAAANTPISSSGIYNLGLFTSVAANALTINITDRNNTTPGTGANAVRVGFRNATLTNGTFSEIQINSARSLVISSGSTLGQASGAPAVIYVYLINNAGTLEVAASGTLYPEVGVISTTAEGGAGAADSNVTMYSATARTNLAYRLVGRITNTQATAGTWASAGTVLAVGNFGTLKATLAPTIQKFTSGSGTYTAPSGVLHLRVRAVGGGGGGAGSSTTAANNGGSGGTGGTTTFGASLISCSGGGAGIGSGAQPGGAGGTSSSGAGPIGTAIQGSSGQGAGQSVTAGTYPTGGAGGASPFGGSGGGGQAVGAGFAAIANSGSGGGGGGAASAGNSGAGGGGGGFVDVIIPNPNTTYAYAVGAAGAAGAAGTSGAVGGAGGSGYIEVTEYY